MYRGWYKGKREFGSARGAVGVLHRRVELAVPRRPGLPDQRAGEGEPALGGRAVPRRTAAGTAGTTPTSSARRTSTSSYPVIAMYITDNWRAFRTWGMSANSPWEYAHLLEAARRASTRAARSSRSTGRTCSARASARTTSSGRYERMDMAYERSDWIATAGGQALSATTCRCWPTSAASPRPSRARTTTSCPARRSRSSSSSSTTPARP